MHETISIADKMPEVKSQNPVPQIRRKTEISQSMNFPVDRILYLQRTIGNQAVQNLMKSGALQAKLRIGQPGDVYEQEADRVAEQVIRMPDISQANDTRIQRKCPKCLKGLTGLLGKDKKDEKLQTKEAHGKTSEVAPHMEANIDALKGGGQPLPESTRAFFEPRFGQDFSNVRLHTDAKAAESARAVNSKAFTVGQDVVFSEGEYVPETREGRKLLAHELTHVVQQQGIIHVDKDKLEILKSEASMKSKANFSPVHEFIEGPISNLTPIQLSVQRACGSKEIGIPECTRGGNVSCSFSNVCSRPFLFDINCDTFKKGEKEALREFVLQNGSSDAFFEIHGFASMDGPIVFNLNLSCARAHRAISTLIDAGTSSTQIRPPIKHGRTEGDENQQRSVVIVIHNKSAKQPPPIPSPPTRTLPTGSFLDLQIACVIDEGGCSKSAFIPYYDTICRAKTGYTGLALVLGDLICAAPGMGIAQSLNRAYPGWLSGLPHCPCTRADAESANNFSKDWNPFLSSYHPGADVCFRSDPLSSVPGTGHRQQCCYTKGGMLITYGGGAGTPDVWNSYSRHQRIDVQPFNEFNKNWGIYNRFWVPDMGSGCPASDPCTNRCHQLFEGCKKSGFDCLAERSFCLNRCRPSRKPP